MSATAAVKAARSTGVHIEIDGDDLVLEASAPPPAAVIKLLSRHKAEIVALLRPAEDGWSLEDWQAFFDERAGFAEFDRDYSRSDAELIAFEECIDHWLALNPPACRSPDACLMCGKHVTGSGIDVIIVTGTAGGMGRIHLSCNSRWEQVRRAGARARLIFLLQATRADLI